MTGSEQSDRPNPDLLLDAVRRTEEKSGKGKLLVFLGMAAGVGKTYAMLNTAREIKARNIDVVIGYVETHGRSETEALLEGLETVPRKIIPYRGVNIEEMDLDAILARKAQVVLVDEAAHTNVQGSRHTKRWHDIREILDSGADVYTTLNVQHLESLMDTVHEITGTAVRETVPDSIIDEADQVILIDLSPEELLERLKEGKVYSEERAGRAVQHFFRSGNLSALRELSLRLVAERVNRDLRDYRQVHHITEPWKTRQRLMVAVYTSPYSETLIRRTRRMASESNAEWYAAYVESDRQLSAEESRLLSENLLLVKELGGKVVTTVDDDPVRGLIRLAHEQQVTQMIVGKSRRNFIYNITHGGSIVQRLLRESGDIDIYIVSGTLSDEPDSLPKPDVNPFTSPFLKDLLLAAGVPVLIGILGHFLDPIIAYRAIGLLFLIGVAILGLFVNRTAIFINALISGFLWNFIFIPPHYTFAISAPEDLMMFAMFLGVAAIIGHLTSRLKLNEKHLRIRERRITAIYNLTRRIADAAGMDDMLNAGIEYMGKVFDADIAILVNRQSEGLSEHEGNTFVLDKKERGVAEWVALYGRPAGLFTDTLPFASAYYLPLVASHGTVGVLALNPKRSRINTPELTALAETFAQQLAMGIEREQLNILTRHTMLVEESERLYKTVLSSVSHELKTPLTTIEGSASALLDPEVSKNPQAVRDLVEEIQDGSHRLSRIVKNFLDMTRLESGILPMNREPTDVGDLISTALRQLKRELAGRTVNLKISDQLPLVNLDYPLIEQAIFNILHNAAIHTLKNTAIDISAFTEKDKMIIVIRDHGPGLPPDNPEKALEKFWRADPSKPGGTGLGLAIAKGWVEAHRGELEVRNHPEGGAEFTISLPLEVHT